MKGYTMEENKKVKLLLMMLLLTSCVAAFCLGTLAYTMGTGELPYEIKVPEQFKSDIPKEQPKYKAAAIPIDESTPDEVTLRSLHDELQEKTKKLSVKESEIQESIKTMEQLVASANDIDAKTQAKLTEILAARKAKVDDIKGLQDKLDLDKKAFIDSQSNLDAKIINRIALTLADMQAENAMIILSDLDAIETARMLNEMTLQKRSDILEELVRVTKINGKTLTPADQLSFRKKANEIVLELRKLKEQPSSTNPVGGNP